jgi:DNA mismatch repair protein MSH4
MAIAGWRLTDVDTLGIRINVSWDPGRKYFLTMDDAEWGEEPLPEVFINIRRNKKKIQCQTLDLKKLSQRQEDASNEIINRSDLVVRELQKFLRGKVPQLFRISESVAVLDMIASFAESAIISRWVRPTYSSTLAVHAARHPILDSVSWASGSARAKVRRQ